MPTCSNTLGTQLALLLITHELRLVPATVALQSTFLFRPVRGHGWPHSACMPPSLHLRPPHLIPRDTESGHGRLAPKFYQILRLRTNNHNDIILADVLRSPTWMIFMWWLVWVNVLPLVIDLTLHFIQRYLLTNFVCRFMRSPRLDSCNIYFIFRNDQFRAFVTRYQEEAFLFLCIM